MGRVLFAAVGCRRLRGPAGLFLVLAALAGAAAVAEAPTRPVTPLTGTRVVVDPGHGGVDAGCHTDGLTEKEVVLAVGLVLAELLQGEGAEVVLTRREDTSLEHLVDMDTGRHRRDLEARVQIARDHRAHIFVSIHANYGRNPAMQGAVTFYPAGDTPGSRAAREMARAVQHEMEQVMPGNHNDVLPARFLVLTALREDALPIMVEVGFLSNPRDRAALEDPGAREAMARAILRGMRHHRAGRAPARTGEPLDPAAPAKGADPSSTVPARAGGPAHQCQDPPEAAQPPMHPRAHPEPGREAVRG